MKLRERKPITEKTCAKCKKEKSVREFYFMNKEHTRIDSYCSICRNKMNLQRWESKKNMN